MSDSILACNCVSFVEKVVILFNSCAFVILVYKKLIDYSQGCAHIFKDSLEPTARFNGDNFNHAKQDNNILHEKFCEMFHH